MFLMNNNRKSSFNNHLNRKNPCKRNNKIKCKYCNNINLLLLHQIIFLFNQ